jgi:hypothetical protein
VREPIRNVRASDERLRQIALERGILREPPPEATGPNSHPALPGN